VSAPALADVPAVGQCGPAEHVKAELTKAGYGNYFVYEVKLFDERANAARWTRESIVASDDLTKGYWVSRQGNSDGQLCLLGSGSGLTLANPAWQAASGRVDPRFYKNQPKANLSDGLNHALDTGAARVAKYPALQIRVVRADGSRGYMTITLNHQTHEGSRLFSDDSGTLIAANTQLEAGKKEQTGFTPLAQEALARSGVGRTGAALGGGPVVAVVEPR